MELKKPVSTASVVETQKNRPVLFILSIILLIGLAAFAVYLYFSKSAIQDQQNQLDTDIASLNSQISQLQSQNLQGQQVAQQFLQQTQNSQIRWSEVVKTLQALIPTDPLTQKPKIQFLSYSGSTGGKLTLNAQTAEGSVNPYADISTLLNVFNNSAFFKDAYVPSITSGVSQTGQDILSFVFNVTYSEQLPPVQSANGINGTSTQQLVPVTPVSTGGSSAVTSPSPSTAATTAPAQTTGTSSTGSTSAVNVPRVPATH